LYGSEKWSLTSTEEHTLQEQEGKKRFSRKLFIDNKEEANNQLRIIHNEELQDLHRLPSIVRTVKSKRL
jgi:hypothetical protein